VVGRPLAARLGLLGAALIGGLGFAAGRASKPSAPRNLPPSRGLRTRLRELSDLHTCGALSDEEFAAARSRLLAP